MPELPAKSKRRCSCGHFAVDHDESAHEWPCLVRDCACISLDEVLTFVDAFVSSEEDAPEITGIDRTALGKLELLADFDITLNGVFDNGTTKEIPVTIEGRVSDLDAWKFMANALRAELDETIEVLQAWGAFDYELLGMAVEAKIGSTEGMSPLEIVEAIARQAYELGKARTR